ncbi:MAG: argininosuccinate lyase [Actinomycetota bacterium]|nr:argininosuccinate lyase [Actinomycetota bacterium]
MTRADAGRPVLAMIESNTTGTGRTFAVAARARGLRPVLLSARPDRYPWAVEDDVDVAWADTNDATSVVAVARAVATGRPLAGVVTSSEYFVAVTAKAATRLGLPGADPAAVERCRDKRRQRVVLAGSGVAGPAYAAAGTPEEAVKAATAVGFPAVVKPADGTGSRGVRLCCDPAEVRHHAASLLAVRQDERGQPTMPAVLVEEYVPGPEVSVETFGTEVVGITAKHLGRLPSFVECGHDFPADLASGTPGAATHLGGPPDRGPVADMVGGIAVAALEALGLGFGPAHTEIRLGRRGPVVIEVNPRLAGGRIPTLVRLATGIDLVGATVDAAVLGGCRSGAGLSLAASAAVIGGTAPAPRGHASIRFLVAPRAGRVRATAGVAEAAAVPGVIDVAIAARAGQRVGGTGSFLDRIGHVITDASTAGAARSAAEAALALLHVDLDTADPGDGVGVAAVPLRRPTPTVVA